jgi:hypothetical protein
MAGPIRERPGVIATRGSTDYVPLRLASFARCYDPKRRRLTETEQATAQSDLVGFAATERFQMQCALVRRSRSCSAASVSIDLGSGVLDSRLRGSLCKVAAEHLGQHFGRFCIGSTFIWGPSLGPPLQVRDRIYPILRSLSAESECGLRTRTHSRHVSSRAKATLAL